MALCGAPRLGGRAGRRARAALASAAPTLHCSPRARLGCLQLPPCADAARVEPHLKACSRPGMKASWCAPCGLPMQPPAAPTPLAHQSRSPSAAQAPCRLPCPWPCHPCVCGTEHSTGRSCRHRARAPAPRPAAHLTPSAWPCCMLDSPHWCTWSKMSIGGGGEGCSSALARWGGKAGPPTRGRSSSLHHAPHSHATATAALPPLSARVGRKGMRTARLASTNPLPP